MRNFLLLIVLSFSSAFANSSIDQEKLKIIEDFLSSMNTLEAEIMMDIDSGDKSREPEHFKGKIWLDRKQKLLRINYGKNAMIAKDGMLIVHQENESPQEFATDDTPAGILLSSSISFEGEGIVAKSLTQINDLWQLCLSYDSPAGLIPVTLYFKPKPIMVLLGWTIQNPNGSITNVHLSPEKIHMAISIDSSIFKFD